MGAQRLTERWNRHDDLLARRTAWDSDRRVHTAALAACKMKDEAILNDNYSLALSFQPDDAALKAWLGNAVAWEFTDAFGTHYTEDRRDWMDTPGIESVTPLYSPKELK